MSLHQFITNILNPNKSRIYLPSINPTVLWSLKSVLLTLTASARIATDRRIFIDITHANSLIPHLSTGHALSCISNAGIVATPARLHSTNRIPSRIPMKALLMKLRSTYYRILNIRKLPTPSQPRETTYLRLWFSVFSTGMSILHANHCPKFYLSMSIICQTPIMSLFTAVS